MSSENVSATRERGAAFDWAVDVIQWAVRNYGALGLKAEHAFEEVALDFGLPPPRVKQVRYRDKVWSMCTAEIGRIAAGIDRHEEQIAIRLEERREALRVQRLQLVLGLQCATDSAGGSDFSVGGSGSGKTNAKVESARVAYLSVARRKRG